MQTVPTQRGIAQLILLLILLVAIPLTVYLAGKSQELRKKAAGENLVAFTDVSGNPLPDKITDPNVYLKITLPDGWSLGQANQNHLIKEAHAQDSCPTPENYSNEEALKNCSLSDLARLSNERLMTFDSGIIVQLPSSRLESFSNEQLIEVGKVRGDLPGFLNRFSNERLLNPAFPGHILNQLPASRIKTFSCDIQQQLGYACGSNPIPVPPPPTIPIITPSPTTPAPNPPTPSPYVSPTPSPTTRALKSLSIENKDTDGSTGGHEPFNLTSNFNDYLGKPIYWKLNNLKPDQTEALRIVQVTFFDGTSYVPLTARITLASSSGGKLQSYGKPNQYDDPPSLVVSDSFSAQRLLQDVGKVGNYQIGFNEDEDGITIEFSPQELTEEEAKEVLNNTDIYYLRALMWILLDSFSTPAHPIDPWYALCDHLRPDLLAKMGAEPTTLANGQILACADPVPQSGEFYPGDPHSYSLYKKIPALTLAKMVETARFTRENKNLQERAKDLAFNLVPLVGPIINAIRNPGSDPSEVAQEMLINEIGLVAGGPIQQGARSVLGLIASKINGKFIIPNFRNVPASNYRNFTEEVALAQTKLRRLENLKVKLVSGRVILQRNLRRVLLQQAGRRWSQESYDQMVLSIKTLYEKLPSEARYHLITYEQVERVLAKMYKQGYFREFSEMDYDILIDSLNPYRTAGVHIPHVNPQQSYLIVRSGIADASTYAHEVIHLIQEMHRQGYSPYNDASTRMLYEGLTDWLLHKELGYLPSFDTEVANIYGMIAAMEAKGVEGTLIARIAALRGQPNYMLNWYRATVGNLEPMKFFANQYAVRSAQGLVLPLAFLRNPDTEEDETTDDIQLDVPPEPLIGESGTEEEITQDMGTEALPDGGDETTVFNYVLSVWKFITGKLAGE